MCRGNIQDGRVHFYYSKCDGMCQVSTSVDEQWFNQHNTDDMSPEELHDLAYSVDECEMAKPKSTSSWWGLG